MLKLATGSANSVLIRTGLLLDIAGFWIYILNFKNNITNF